jgi:hypothetical protein
MNTTRALQLWAALVVGVLAGHCLPATSTTGAADEQEKPKATARWEYCTVLDHGGSNLILDTAAQEVRAKNWTELAEKLKAPIPEGLKGDYASKVAVFNSLGAQGWELAGHVRHFNQPFYNDQYTFKRHAEK